MKKILITTLLILSVMITGCLGTHKIEIETGKDEIVSCPKRANAGETVTVETISVSDADLFFYLDGVELKPVKEGFYQFEMPDHDVSIKVVVVSNGMA